MSGGITAALLFADIEGSTRLLVQLGDRYGVALADYRDIVGKAVLAGGGEIVDTEGDGLFALFPTVGGAIAAAMSSQRSLAAHAWPEAATVRVRMGLHVGEVRPAPTGYVGLPIHVAARVASAAHGGQIVATAGVAGLGRAELPPDATFRDLGEHRLKDIELPERLFQLDVEGLPDDFPPPRGVRGRRHNLPAPVSSFIGREAESGEIDGLLDNHRLVTLTGAGGAGKTRLALHAATARLDSFRDGVWLVDLSELNDPTQIAAHVGRAIGVAEPRAGEVLDQVLHRLDDAELLLLMDNCEHLLADVAATVGQIVRAAPGVKVLATSREALSVRGEASYWVRSLGLPPPSAPPEVSRDSPAVRLFIERATEVRASLEIDDAALVAVAEICRRLDGIPLALELAAARTNLLSPHQLLDRLDDAFTVLGSADRSAPTRQRTLRATLDWSHGLLSDAERVLLRRLGVFSGGFTLEAAEHVCVAPPIGPDDLLDALGHLVASSVVTRAEWTESRYGMLRTVRSYARRRLDAAGETDDMAAAHAAYFRGLVLGGGQALHQREQAAFLAELEADHDNLRSALRWLIDSGDAAGAIDLAGDMIRFWYRRGYFGEGRRWIEEVLGMDAAAPSPGLANVLRFAAATAMDSGDGDRAAALAERAAAVARDVGDAALLARSLNVRSGIAWRLGDLGSALRHYEEAIALLANDPDPFLVNLHVNRAHLLIDMGLLDDAEASLESSRRFDFSEHSVDLRQAEAALRYARDDLEAAEAMLAEVVATYRELGLVPNLASALRTRAEVARAAGRLDDARSLGEEAMQLFLDIDDPSNRATVEIFLAGLDIDRGALQEARATIARCLAELHDAGWRLAVHDGLLEAAALAAREGRWCQWARLSGAVDALAATFPVTATPSRRRAYDRTEAEAASVLGTDNVRGERAAGAAMSLAEIVAYATDDSPLSNTEEER